MYNLYVREEDGSVILGYANLTLDEILRMADDILSEGRWTEVIISEASHGRS